MDPNRGRVGLALIAGFVSFLTPCVLSLVPAYVGYFNSRAITAEGTVVGTRHETLAHELAFVLGFSAVFIALSAVANAIVVNFAVRVIRTKLGLRTMNSLHWLSNGTASVARGLNNSPKIVALGVARCLVALHTGTYQAPYWLFALAVFGVGLGSFIGGLEATETLAKTVTRMDRAERFAANITTAALVAGASNLGLPVSTTDVSSGAFIAIGLPSGVGRVNGKVARDMVLAPVVSLPGAVLLGPIAYCAQPLERGGAG
jgi:phosphate/sulfate permease